MIIKGADMFGPFFIRQFLAETMYFFIEYDKI